MAADAPKMDDAVTRAKTKMAIAAQQGASKKSLDSYRGNVTKLEKMADNRRAVIDEFRKSYGDAIKQELTDSLPKGWMAAGPASIA